MIAANFFDGHSARLHPVHLLAGDGSLAVNGDGVQRVYPLAGVTMTEPYARASSMLHFADGACCEVAGDSRAVLAAALGYRLSRVTRWQDRWPAALVALVLLIALLFVTVVWGVPAAAERIANALPASTDRTLGKGTLDILQSRHLLLPSRLSDQRIAQVQQVLAKVQPAQPRMPLRLLVRNSPRFGVNALALPDGTIVITDQMVRQIMGKKAEFGDYELAQLAGVLAHEIGHVEARHSTRLLARSSLLGALSASLFGDFSAVAAGVPAALMNMHYSREMETDADSYAIATLRQRGLPLAPMADLFEDRGGEESNDPKVWKLKRYVSSHPTSATRSERLRKAGP